LPLTAKVYMYVNYVNKVTGLTQIHQSGGRYHLARLHRKIGQFPYI